MLHAPQANAQSEKRASERGIGERPACTSRPRRRPLRAAHPQRHRTTRRGSRAVTARQRIAPSRPHGGARRPRPAPPCSPRGSARRRPPPEARSAPAPVGRRGRAASRLRPARSNSLSRRRARRHLTGRGSRHRGERRRGLAARAQPGHPPQRSQGCRTRLAMGGRGRLHSPGSRAAACDDPHPASQKLRVTLEHHERIALGRAQTGVCGDRRRQMRQRLARQAREQVDDARRGFRSAARSVSKQARRTSNARSNDDTMRRPSPNRSHLSRTHVIGVSTRSQRAGSSSAASAGARGRQRRTGNQQHGRYNAASHDSRYARAAFSTSPAWSSM